MTRIGRESTRPKISTKKNLKRYNLIPDPIFRAQDLAYHCQIIHFLHTFNFLNSLKRDKIREPLKRLPSSFAALTSLHVCRSYQY